MLLATGCREAAILSPTHSRALKLLGSALYALGDLKAARSALEQSLHLQPAYADAHCDLGCTLCALGEAAAAKAAFQNAVRHNSMHMEVGSSGLGHHQCCAPVTAECTVGQGGALPQKGSPRTHQTSNQPSACQL